MRELVMITFIAYAPFLAGQSHTQAAGQAEKAGHLDRGFFGTWKQDTARSKLGAVTRTYEQKGDSIESITGDTRFTYKIDGQEHPADLPGRAMVWKKTGTNTYDVVATMNGKEFFTSKREISADGKTLTETTTMKNPAATDVVVWERLSGKSSAEPLIGTWRSDPARSKVQASGYILRMQPSDDGIQVFFGSATEYRAKFDNQEQPLSGKTAASGTTVSLKRINDRSFEEITHRNGKQTYTRRYVLSQDGRTLTQTNINSRGQETAVFFSTNNRRAC